MSIGLALLVAVAQPAPAEQHAPPRYPLSDERLARIGDAGFILAETIEHPVFADPEVIAAFRRIGIGRGCALYNSARSAVLARHEPPLSPIVVAALRRHVHAELLAQPTHWHANSMLPFHRRVLGEVHTNGAEIFSQARSELAGLFLEQAASAPEVPAAEASGDFADWDLERRLARQTACMIVRVGRPEGFAARKRPCDGFFQRQAR